MIILGYLLDGVDVIDDLFAVLFLDPSCDVHSPGDWDESTAGDVWSIDSLRGDLIQDI